MKKQESKIVFFFGAGAEQSAFNLPSGTDYTRETMLTKKEEMYSVLKEFYKDTDSKYVDKYISLFLFRRDSHTFREMIGRAAKDAAKADDCDEKTKEFAEKIERYKEADEKFKNSKLKSDEELKKALKNQLDNLSGMIYDVIVDNKQQGYDSLKNHLFYYGVIEKDFATILAPDAAGKGRFWRLINYFWSAFFAIFLPICEQNPPSWFPLGEGNEKQKYKSVLEDFPNRIKEVLKESKDFDKDADKGTDNYYSAFSEAFPHSYVLTTNYTPFLERYFCKEKCIYLAGKLSEFEYPTKLLVKDVTEDIGCAEAEEIENNCFVFPFLMTQAPIKPIIAPLQIKAYAKAIDKLENASDLVIIGYSLGKADNHINAILRDYIVNKEKRLIYCVYSTDNDEFEEEAERADIIKKLMLPEYMRERIIIVQNNGNANDLLKRVQVYINES
ncbi:MAG: hypothetical protein J1E62_07625 [Lachnospiraceae bacterium]|nr:hypothetical protein [Lachnospiraceae bacterium]